jgi:hypothetical protein
MDQFEMSTSTASWLWSSIHSIVGSLVPGWYMISLKTTAESARAVMLPMSRRPANEMKAWVRVMIAIRQVVFMGVLSDENVTQTRLGGKDFAIKPGETARKKNGIRT